MSVAHESVRGVLACDGAHVQCHECGDWFRSLTTHIRLAHGMSDDEYRYEWDLPASTRLAGDEVRNTARAHALQRVDQAGPQEVPRFVPGTYVEGGAVAAEYDDRARVLWAERLEAAGWASWEAAVDWAVEHDKTWSDIAAKLGITHQQARSVGMAHGVVLPPLWQRMVVVARAHVDRYGTLLNTTGRLSAWLSRTRHESQTKRLPRRAVAALDRLDPDWRLAREARREAMRRRNVANGHQVSSFRTFDAQVRAAGFDGVAGLLRHGIVEHRSPSELGELVGVRGDSLLNRMTIGNPENPFDAIEELCSSVFGMLDDDGSRVQCHECGLWFGVLYHHLTWHTGDDGGPLTAEAYRKRHGLPADLPLRSDDAFREAISGQWDARLQEAGFVSWEDALAATAQDHLGLSDLGERLGVRGDALPAVLAREVPGDPWAATEPFRVSTFGHLEDDGERSQCHECGLWYRRVGSHVSAHSGDDGEPLTFDEYRARHGLEGELGRRRGASETWTRRLSEAGYGTWDEVLADLARSHRNLRDFADQVGVKDSSVVKELLKIRPEGTWAPTEPFRLSTYGHLEDDGERVQCHECGLWFAMLMRGHVGVHVDDDGRSLTAETYRKRHGLAADAALRSVPRNAPAVAEDWRPRLAQLGYSSWEEALAGLARNHRNLKDLAVDCGRKDTAAESLFRDRPASVWDATAPHRLSGPGHLADDGSRTQCHECGLWFEHLDRHVSSHRGDDGRALSAESYREKHGLPAGFTLRSVPRADGDADSLWARRLGKAGFATWEEALVDLAKKHRNLKDLADRMGVAVNLVTKALLRSRPVDTWVPTEPYRLGQYGHIEDDGARSQCHECGLWFERLGRHTKVHLDTDGTPLTWERYRERYGVQRAPNWSREKERRAKKPLMMSDPDGTIGV